MNRPNFSAIIPTYNGASWLGETLESVCAQSHAAAEIIVIDDGSTDQTAEVLARFQRRIRILRQERGGIGAARNRGIQAATGDYLAFLDHDDLWHSHKLEYQARYLHAHPRIDVLYTDALEFAASGMVHASYCGLSPGLRQPTNLFHKIIHFQVPLMSTVCVRAAFLREQRLAFVESASGVDDIGLFLEILGRQGRWAFLDEVLVSRRLHQSNLSKSHYNRFAKRCVLYRELLERLKQATPAQRRALRWGLRDAHYRVGEFWWGELDLARAAEHFDRALGADWLGFRAALRAGLCRLPCRVVAALQWCKRSRWLATLRRSVA